LLKAPKSAKRRLELVDLSDIKAAVVSAAPGFGDIWIRSFDWRQNGNVITAKPRYPISDMCRHTMLKVFRRLGGKYVSNGKGGHYFELVLKPEAEQNGVGCNTLFRVVSAVISPHVPDSVFKRLENQLHGLAETGKRLTE
jgi:hypothetical protein